MVPRKRSQETDPDTDDSFRVKLVRDEAKSSSDSETTPEISRVTKMIATAVNNGKRAKVTNSILANKDPPQQQRPKRVSKRPTRLASPTRPAPFTAQKNNDPVTPKAPQKPGNMINSSDDEDDAQVDTPAVRDLLKVFGGRKMKEPKKQSN